MPDCMHKDMHCQGMFGDDGMVCADGVSRREDRSNYTMSSYKSS